MTEPHARETPRPDEATNARHDATNAQDDATNARDDATGARRAALHAAAVLTGYTLFCVAFFAPVLFSERLLAPGDGMIYFLPNFHARRALWDNSIWGGHPAVGDSQLMTWYPPARLFSLLGSWHAFLVSAYVLACSFAYGYAHAVTRSRLAAAVAGTTYGMGGFLVAHAGHAALVHAAAWTPALVWSLEMLHRRRADGRARAFWLAAAALSTACAALAGHPQIFAYTLLLAGAYALARGWRTDRQASPDDEPAPRVDEQPHRPDRDASDVDEQARLSDRRASHGDERTRRADDDARDLQDDALHVDESARAATNAHVVFDAPDVPNAPDVTDAPDVSGASHGSGASGASSTPVGVWRERLSYYSACALAVALGLGLASIQLVPTAELARESLRASLGFREFVSYSLPLRQTPMLLFPYLFGGSPGTLYDRAYFGAWGSEVGGWGAGELSGYAGLLPLLLAAVGFLGSRRRDLAWLWLAVAALAFLLALGDKTPLAWLAYRLPVLNKFRVPARHYLELTLALSALAALGVKALQQRAATARLVTRVATALAASMIACLLGFALFAEEVNAWAAERLTRPVHFAPWSNAATAVPLLVLAAAYAALLFWRRAPRSRARVALLLVVLALDLSSFTWFYEWHYAAPPRDYLRAPSAAAPLRDELARTHARLLPARGGTGRVAELPPNLSKLWGYPSASGYGPFILARASRLFGMPPHGSTDAWNDPANRAPDLLAVRYLLVPRPAPDDTPAQSNDSRADPRPPSKDSRAPSNDSRTPSDETLAPSDQTRPPSDETLTPFVEWAREDANVVVGHGCGAADSDSFRVELPRAVEADSLALVSALACSVQLADGAEVARLVLTDVDGRTHAAPILAGRDTSEWAYDCADVRPHLRQRRAQIFRSYAAEREGGVRCEGHDFVARLALPGGPKQIKAVELRWVGASSALAVKKLTLAHEAARASTPVDLTPDAPGGPTGKDGGASDPLADASRWRRVAEIDAGSYGPAVRPEDAGASVVYENLRALPRAWLVPEVLRLNEDDALAAALTSRLPDGRQFDPTRLALVEESLTLAAHDDTTATPRNDTTAANREGTTTTGRADATTTGRDGALMEDGAGATTAVESSRGEPGGAFAAGTAKVLELSDNSLEVETDARGAAFLVTSDAYYEGWRASVDGRPERVVRANYLLRGLAVPPGRHRVRFEFAPASFRYGAALSLASLALLAACALLIARRQRSTKTI